MTVTDSTTHAVAPFPRRTLLTPCTVCTAQVWAGFILQYAALVFPLVSGSSAAEAIAYCLIPATLSNIESNYISNAFPDADKKPGTVWIFLNIALYAVLKGHI